jgi:hypothetical protein
VVLLEAEEMPDEKKPTSESKHPSSCIKRGKIKLEVYGKEVMEWNSNGHNHR